MHILPAMVIGCFIWFVALAASANKAMALLACPLIVSGTALLAISFAEIGRSSQKRFDDLVLYCFISIALGVLVPGLMMIV